MNNIICESILKKYDVFEQIISILSIQEGLEYLAQTVNKPNFPDLIFLDLRFPEQEKNAWDFLNECAIIQDKSTELYILTSSIAKKDANIVQEYPFIKGFISKPLNEEKIKKILNLQLHA
jgi:response regulator RpfG family c-di-GMP phosphodiesterase